MLLQKPFSVLSPSVDGDVLDVLARDDRAVPLPTLVRLVPDRSRSGIVRVLDRLVEQGIVLHETVADVNTYELNRDHLLADVVLQVSRTRSVFLERLRSACAVLPIRYAALFGSGARGEMRPDSDIDMLFVVDHRDRDRAADGIFDLATAARRWTGNAVHPIVYEAERITRDDPLIRSVADEGVALGPDPDWLRARLRTASA